MSAKVPSAPSPSDGLPDKEFFKIGEVARLVGVEPYVLRFWESEFKRDIRPERTRSNQRMYRRRDVETFLEIKRLRYDEKLELSGARRRLRQPDTVARDSAAATAYGASRDDREPELPFASLIHSKVRCAKAISSL